MYSREGKRTDYTPYSCMKIIMGNPPGSGDAHGCPYRHYDTNHLAATLGKLRIDKGDSDAAEYYEELFGAVMTSMDPSEPSRALNIVFQLLPSRKRYPEYYDDIGEPMDLKTVAEKVQRSSTRAWRTWRRTSS